MPEPYPPVEWSWLLSTLRSLTAGETGNFHFRQLIPIHSVTFQNKQVA